MTNLEPPKRASALILIMDPVAREVCMAAGSDQILGADGVMKIVKLLNDYFAPDAADSVHQAVACFFN